MLSREFRRLRDKKKEKTETIVDKKRESHPFLYAFSVVILVIIVVTFVGTPAIRSGSMGGRISFGSYKGKPIEYYPGNYFSQQKDLLAEQLRQAGEKEDLEVQAYKVWRGAFDQAVFHTAMMVEAGQAGVWVSEDRVDKALIQSGPYTLDGKFSEEKYRSASAAERFATRKLFREQLIQEQFLQDVFSGERTSGKEKGFFKEMMSLERRFSLASFPFSGYPEAEVLSYARDNRERFSKIKVSRILIKSSEADAGEVLKKLKARNSTFEELARAHSKDAYAEKGGDMGWRYFYDLQNDFESPQPVQAILKLKEGELSPVLKTRYGWTIFRCDSQAVELDQAAPEAVKTVKDYLMRYEKGKVEDYFQKQAQGFAVLAREKGFLEACKRQSLTPVATDFFPINYQTLFFLTPARAKDPSTNLSQASFSQDFFEAAFSLKPDQISDAVLLEDQVVVLKLDEERKTPEDQLALADDYFRYFAGQGLQADLQNILLNSENLVDNFNAAFYEHIFPKPQAKE